MANVRRKQLIVDRKLQLGLGMQLIGWVYLYVVGFTLVSIAPSLIRMSLSDAASPEYAEAVYRVQSFGRFVALPLMFTFLAMCLHGVLLTHRLAGPVYRFKVVARDMARRAFPAQVTVRPRDFHHDLAAELDTACRALRSHDARTRELVAGLTTLVADGTDAEAIGDACRTLAQHVAEHTAASPLPTPDEIAGPEADVDSADAAAEAAEAAEAARAL